jgi:hypothetical protein
VDSGHGSGYRTNAIVVVAKVTVEDNIYCICMQTLIWPLSDHHEIGSS